MATVSPAEPRFLLQGVSWEEYEIVLKLCEEKQVRLTYDRGLLELMSPSYQHGLFQHILARLVATLSLELDIPIRGAANTTFKNQMRDRGLEPDECFWVEHEPQMRGKLEFDFDIDLLPDLAIEIEVTRGAFDKLETYGGLGFPEVWRFDGTSLHVHQLKSDGTYESCSRSRNFPGVPIERLADWVSRALELDENTLVRSFANWVRAGMATGDGDS
jgi:Uma2 family endonuclease